MALLTFLESLLAPIQNPNVLLSGILTFNGGRNQGGTLLVLVENEDKF
jgi:hypothetical protein